MKESERIKAEMMSDDSDNDWRDANYLHKIKRAERKESFEETLLIGLQKSYEIKKLDNSYEIFTDKYGRIIFYPKANSLLITKDNYWVKGYAIRWINKYLIN